MSGKQSEKAEKLWEDIDFPANSISLSFINEKNDYEWKRPKEINEDAVFIFNGASRFDVKQTVKKIPDRGHFYSVLASVANHDTLFKNLVPEFQNFEENYTGEFRFRFCRLGQWREVKVDDRLPTEADKLAFAYSGKNVEFWSALMQKAYAKMYGSYDAIQYVSLAEVMCDLTGGVSVTILLRDNTITSDLYTKMLKYQSVSSIMCCEIERIGKELFLENGLMTLQSHSITDVVQMNLNDGNTSKLIRIFNPWGNEEEWKNQWSDVSEMWNSVSQKDKEKYNINKKNGEFWMSFDDFIANFTILVVCYLGDNPIDDKPAWNIKLHTGAWVKNFNAGGSRTNINTYATNPQFLVKLLESDKNNEDNEVTIIVSLTQNDLRKQNLKLNFIAFDIYQLYDTKPVLLDKLFYKSNKPIARSLSYSNKTEISGTYSLRVGNYVIVPSTYYPGNVGQFSLKIGALKLETMEMDEATGRIDVVDDIEERIANMTFDTLGKELEIIFEKISGSQLVINATELRKILNTILAKDTQVVEMKEFKGFSIDDCRSIISLYDINRNGKMELPEFLELFKNLRIWKNVFKEFDADNNGVFNAYEYRKCLNHCGFSVSNQLLKTLVLKYMDFDYGYITFGNLIMSLIRLTNSFNSVEEIAKNSYHTEMINPYECLNCMMSM